MKHRVLLRQVGSLNGSWLFPDSLDFGLLHIIENCIGRTFDCECQMLNDEKEVARRRLSAAFGLDFGKRDLDVV